MANENVTANIGFEKDIRIDFNVYGMHIIQENSTLSEENPHVCIGWSGLGDLSAINTKQELDDLYKLKNPSDSNQRKGANVSQIWMFIDTMKIGDYVVYFDGSTAHFGKVIGNYEYIEDMPNQSSDYVNNRKVEWIKDIAYKFDNIRIPSNMFIYTTMNTSDQNVFTLDTAFKRRWNFEKIKNTFLANHPYKDYYIPVMDITWEEFSTSINKAIVNTEDFLNSEDKQLGVFFVDKKCLREKSSEVSNLEKRKEFAYKVFEYLWDDVTKYDHTILFNANFKTLDDVIDAYVNYENEINQDTGEKIEKMNPDKIFKNGIFKL